MSEKGAGMKIYKSFLLMFIYKITNDPAFALIDTSAIGTTRIFLRQKLLYLTSTLHQLVMEILLDDTRLTIVT